MLAGIGLALLMTRQFQAVLHRHQRLSHHSRHRMVRGPTLAQTPDDPGETGHVPLAIPDTALSAGESTFGHAGVNAAEWIGFYHSRMMPGPIP